jgi:hypothetical protein
MKILVTDAEKRKSFDIINIILRYYSKTSLLIATTKNSLLLNIIYPGLKTLRTTNFITFEYDFKKILTNISCGEQIVYFPVEEIVTLYFYNFIEKNKNIRNRFIFLLPSFQSFNLSRNKYLLNLFCRENNIIVPDIITDINVVKNNFKPLIHKPKIGTGSKGIKIIKTKDELDNIVYDNNYFLQYFIGNGVTVDGGFYLMNKGELIFFYSHRRIRTYPQEGGVSVFSKSTENNRIKDIGAELLHKLNWSGLAMIEFVYDEKNDRYMVIEINPRAWGSILLSEINQSHFVINYIRLAMGMHIEKSHINYDTYIRWLIPWDIILYIRRLGKIKNFWKVNIKNTAYIGFTYSNIFRSFLFVLYSSLNFKHIKKIMQCILL